MRSASRSPMTCTVTSARVTSSGNHTRSRRATKSTLPVAPFAEVLTTTFVRRDVGRSSRSWKVRLDDPRSVSSTFALDTETGGTGGTAATELGELVTPSCWRTMLVPCGRNCASTLDPMAVVERPAQSRGSTVPQHRNQVQPLEDRSDPGADRAVRRRIRFDGVAPLFLILRLARSKVDLMEPSRGRGAAVRGGSWVPGTWRSCSVARR